MLYICILSNKFDLKQTIRVLHKTQKVSCHTADYKPVKHEVNVTVILPPLVFPVMRHVLGEPNSVPLFREYQLRREA